MVVTTTAQLYSTKPELRLHAGSTPARGMSEVRDGEEQWFWLEITLNAFCWSTILQKTFHHHHHHHHHHQREKAITKV